MQKNKYQIVLASASPRRKELLASSFLPFEIIPADIEEVSRYKGIEEIVLDLADQKSLAVFESIKSTKPNPFVIGSDTVVVIDDQILGKPKDRAEAKAMLKQLSGRSHFVYTSVSFKTRTAQHAFFEKTEVFFETISEDLLELYLDTEESMDKAGAYGIQQYALSFINKIHGSYSSVVGLPINRVISEMKLFLHLDQNTLNWRNNFE